jgi:hypothetical protein
LLPDPEANIPSFFKGFKDILCRQRYVLLTQPVCAVGSDFFPLLH